MGDHGGFMALGMEAPGSVPAQASGIDFHGFSSTKSLKTSPHAVMFPLASLSGRCPCSQQRKQRSGFRRIHEASSDSDPSLDCLDARGSSSSASGLRIRLRRTQEFAVQMIRFMCFARRWWHLERRVSMDRSCSALRWSRQGDFWARVDANIGALAMSCRWEPLIW